MFINSKSSVRDKSLSLFAAVWASVIAAPLVYSPGSSAFTGHPWKAELATAFILCIFLTGWLFTNRKYTGVASISRKIVSHIIAPCGAFIIWSALSAFWAGSISSVLHHTLVWACYLIFFVFAVSVVSDKKLFKISLISLGLIIGVICVSSVIEFVSKAAIEYRYAKFAEIFAALLPLSFSYVLRLNRKYLVWASFITVLLWLGILFSLSRGALLSSVVGLFVFISFRIFTKQTFGEKRRLVFAALSLAFIASLTQITSFASSSSNEQKTSTFSRVVVRDEKDPSNSIAQNARLLFAGVGKEMFFDNYLSGVGADNFGLEFNKYRRVFSAKPENKSIANLQEELLPQRAHNEYLQIAAELGVIGAAIILSLLCGMAKLGFAEIKKNRFGRANILTHSATAGIAAFLVSSLFSSFSFRLMQNGLVFFFLLAILLRNFALEKNRDERNNFLVAPRLKSAFVSIALTVCLCLTIFSALKAASRFFAYQAENQENFETAKRYYENAILLDPANASADYSFAVRLSDEGSRVEAAEQLGQAVEKGINASVNYSHLISAQILASQFRRALDTSSEAVEIFPYSVFTRVRYAVLLKKFHGEEESDEQFKIAARLDKKQAETWRLVIIDGTFAASREAGVNKEILKLDDLTPPQAIYTVLTEREILEMNEKIEKSKLSF